MAEVNPSTRLSYLRMFLCCLLWVAAPTLESRYWERAGDGLQAYIAAHTQVTAIDADEECR